MKITFFYTLFILFIFIFLEFSSFIFSKLNLLYFNDKPKIYRSNSELVGMEWLNEKESWGAWHKKNVVSRHTSRCFDITYKSNNLGLRGDKIDFNNKKNIFLLGDSFAEGWGVDEKKILKHLIEKEFSSQVINLGISGDVGPLQYYLIYKNFKDILPHDKIIILFFPFNDFTDNDYHYWENTKQKFFGGKLIRHRPYFKIQENDFNFFIPKNSVKRENWYGEDIINKSFKLKFELFIIKNLWFGNIYKSLKFIYYSNPFKAITNPYSGYFDPSSIQQKKSLFYIEQILKLSENKEVILLSIPRNIDLINANKNNSQLDIMPWYKKFKSMENNKKYNFKFIDLSIFQNAHDKEIFLSCDGHWSEKGNLLAFETLKKYINF